MKIMSSDGHQLRDWEELLSDLQRILLIRLLNSFKTCSKKQRLTLHGMAVAWLWLSFAEEDFYCQSDSLLMSRF